MKTSTDFAEALKEIAGTVTCDCQSEVTIIFGDERVTAIGRDGDAIYITIYHPNEKDYSTGGKAGYIVLTGDAVRAMSRIAADAANHEKVNG